MLRALALLLSMLGLASTQSAICELQRLTEKSGDIRAGGENGRAGLTRPIPSSQPKLCLSWLIDLGIPLHSIEFNTSSFNFQGSDTLTFYSSTEIQPDRIVGTFSVYARLPRTMILTGSTRALIVLRTSSPLTYVRMTYAVRATSDIQIWSFRISPLSLILWLLIWFLLIAACCSATCCLVRRRRGSTNNPRRTVADPMRGTTAVILSQAQHARQERVEQQVTEGLRALPTKAYDVELDPPGERSECCLCMETFQPGEEVRQLPCSHFFHRSCIDRWFATKVHQVRSCPLCKRDPLDGGSTTHASPLESDGAGSGPWQAGEADGAGSAERVAAEPHAAVQASVAASPPVAGAGTELTSLGSAISDGSDGSDGSIETVELPNDLERGR